MPQLVTDKCPYCDNLQQSRKAAVTDCTFCNGLGATLKPQFVGTQKGRSAFAALVAMRKMRVQVRDKAAAERLLATQHLHLVQS